MKINFLFFLNILDKFTSSHKYDSFSYLIDSIKNTELIKEYSSQIKTQFLNLLNNIEKLCDCGCADDDGYPFCDEYHREDAFYYLNKGIKDTCLEEEKYYKKLLNEHLEKETE